MGWHDCRAVKITASKALKWSKHGFDSMITEKSWK